jgi:hypothetical protein
MGLTQRGEERSVEKIKRADYYGGHAGQWTREPTQPRYLGLTAAQFDIAVLGLIAATVLSVWLFVFHGTTTAREFLGLEPSSPITVTAPPESSVTDTQPMADPAAAPVAAAPPAEAVPPPDAAPAPVLSPEQELLMASAQSLAGVRSFRGRFQMSMTANGESANAGGDILFQAPDQMHMTMNISGQTFEVLAQLPNMYLRVPHQGWYVLNGEALGFSASSLNDYINNRGLFNYGSQAQAFSGVTQLPDEEIDGALYLHYQAILEFEDFAGALPSDVFDPSLSADLHTVSGPIRVDLWLDRETKLPRRHAVTMELEANGQAVSMEMRMAINEYNGEVTIPAAPTDARPFDAIAEAYPPEQTD